MELSEMAIEKKETEGIKTEFFDISNLLDNSFLNVTLINSPDKITKDVINEIISKSKPINMITLDKHKWTSTIIDFGIEFIYVNAPSGFKIYIGEQVLIEIQTDKGNYIIQAVLHKYVIRKMHTGPVVPVLALRLLDPRMNKRYNLHEHISAKADYKIIDNDVFWRKNSNYLLVRNTGYSNGENKRLIINETIGKGSGLKLVGDDDVVYLDKEMAELRNNMKQSEITNISAGGCGINTDDKGIKPGSLLLLSIIVDLNEIKYKFNGLELLLFAIVRNVRSFEENNYRCGIKFAIKIDDGEPAYNMFEKCLSQIN